MPLPKDTITIEHFIDSGRSTTFNYFNLSMIYKIDKNTWVSLLNVFNDYISELRNACVNVELSQQEQFKYFYKPKLLCYDVYGNPELYYIILLINDMADVKEFTKPKLKMLKKDHMSTLASLIYNAEKGAISSYNEKLAHNETRED